MIGQLQHRRCVGFFVRLAPVTVALALLLGADAPTARSDTLEAQLRTHAPQITQGVKEAGFKNIGVLKFLVKNGDDPASENAGLLNLTMARRLTVAMILEAGRENIKKEPTLNIIGDANAVAATLKGANHLSKNKADVSVLFDTEYPLAWGKSKVKPDAFLTGVVHIQPDFKTVKIHVCTLDANAEVRKMTTLTASTTPDLLAEAGVSFLRRTQKKKGDELVIDTEGGDTVPDKVVDRKKGDTPHPLNDAKNNPVLLSLYYDGVKQPFDVKKGEVEIPGPRPNQTIHFELARHPNAGNETFGVVLMVNGENTLYQERKSPELCRKWILEPGDRATKILGYQVENKDEALPFRVLPADEAKRQEVNYSRDLVGTISMFVYRNRPEGQKAPVVPLNPNVLEDKAIRNSPPTAPLDLPKDVEPPSSPDDLAERFIKPSTKRLVVPDTGNSIVNPVRIVSFKADPTPVMSARIRYYKPQK